MPMFETLDCIYPIESLTHEICGSQRSQAYDFLLLLIASITLANLLLHASTSPDIVLLLDHYIYSTTLLLMFHFLLVVIEFKVNFR